MVVSCSTVNQTDGLVSGKVQNNKFTDEILDKNTGPTCLSFTQTDCSDYVNWYGRNYLNASHKTMICNNSAAGFEVAFYGTSLLMTYISEYTTENFLNGIGYICISVDGNMDWAKNQTPLPIVSYTNKRKFALVEGLTEGLHTVTVRKATEDWYVSLEIYSIETDGFFVEPPPKPRLRLEFFGDSITAGRSANRIENENETDDSLQENAMLSYTFQTAQTLNAQVNLFCVSGARLSTNYLSSIDGAISIPVYSAKYYPSANVELQWDVVNYVPDAVVIDLGTNDFISIAPTEENFEEKFKAEYKKFVALLRERYPNAKIVICGGTFTYGTMNISVYNELFHEIVREIEDENVFSYVFSHPTDIGHPRAEEAIKYGKELAVFLQAIL